MKERKSKQTNVLQSFNEKPSGLAIGLVMIVFFALCVGMGAILKILSTSAGRSWLAHLAIWVPLTLLAYYLFRAIRSYQRLPQQNDLEFSERLRQRLEQEKIQIGKPPASKEIPAVIEESENQDGQQATSPRAAESPKDPDPPSSPS